MCMKTLRKTACLSLLGTLLFFGGCSTTRSVLNPQQLVFPYEWVGDVEKCNLVEPSGIVYHGRRGTLFAVGDEGDLCEMKTDGTPVKRQRIRDADFEGVTVNPTTGLLYLAIEGEEKVLEVDPDTFAVLREFELERYLRGETVFKPGGQGIEGITFVPDPENPEGGTFYVSNQSFSLNPGAERSLIAEVQLPLRSSSARTEKGRILRTMSLGVIDMSDLSYDTRTGHILVVSDATNTFYEIDRNGRILTARAFPGNDQEGLTMDPDGFMYIAQDSGGIIKIKPKWRPQGH